MPEADAYSGVELITILHDVRNVNSFLMGNLLTSKKILSQLSF